MKYSRSSARRYEPQVIRADDRGHRHAEHLGQGPFTSQDVTKDDDAAVTALSRLAVSDGDGTAGWLPDFYRLLDTDS